MNFNNLICLIFELKMFQYAQIKICPRGKMFQYPKLYTTVTGFFPATFAKINTVTGIFQGFYLDFQQFSIVCKISGILSNGRFRKFQ